MANGKVPRQGVIDRVLFLFALVSCVGAGCASDRYQFRQSEREDLVYYVPAADPDGEVRIRSYGIAEIEQPDYEKKIPAIHLRMTIENREGIRPWKMNAKEQVVFFSMSENTLPDDAGEPVNDSKYKNEEVVHPIVAFSDEETVPEVEILPGEFQVVDLFYPLPGGSREELEVSSFQFRWKLKAGSVSVGEKTQFQKERVPPRIAAISPFQPYPYPYVYGFTWGRRWWVDLYRPEVSYGSPELAPPLDGGQSDESDKTKSG